MKLPIIQAPDARLHIVAQEIPQPKEEHLVPLQQMVQDLQDTFDDTDNCIGLAATQLGIPWRVIIVDITPRRTETYVMVNPVFTKMSDDLQLVYDGCMSVGHGQKKAYTKRPKRIGLSWVDPTTWTVKQQKFSGLLAACIHHEIDHLDGVLFTDRILMSGAVKIDGKSYI